MPDTFRIPAGGFCTEVLQGTFCAHTRECALHENLFPIPGLKVEVALDPVGVKFCCRSGLVGIRLELAQFAALFPIFEQRAEASAKKPFAEALDEAALPLVSW